MAYLGSFFVNFVVVFFSECHLLLHHLPRLNPASHPHLLRIYTWSVLYKRVHCLILFYSIQDRLINYCFNLTWLLFRFFLQSICADFVPVLTAYIFIVCTRIVTLIFYARPPTVPTASPNFLFLSLFRINTEMAASRR